MPQTCSTCHHDRQAHQHYRRGSDCASCDCVKHRVGVAARVRALLHRPDGHKPIDSSGPVEPHAPAA